MEYSVYILRSCKDNAQFIGYTTNLNERMQAHANADKSAYTRRYSPWELETYIVFKNEEKAKAFELYLKSHSGRAFFRKCLVM